MDEKSRVSKPAYATGRAIRIPSPGAASEAGASGSENSTGAREPAPPAHLRDSNRAQWPLSYYLIGATIALFALAALFALLFGPAPSSQPEARRSDRSGPGAPPPRGESYRPLGSMSEGESSSRSPEAGAGYPPGFRPMKPKPMAGARGAVVTGPDGRVRDEFTVEGRSGNPDDFVVEKVAQDSTQIREKER